MANWFTELVLLALGGLVTAVIIEVRRGRRECRQWREVLTRMSREFTSC